MKNKIILEDLIEDLLDSRDKKFNESIKKAREEYKNGKVFTHEQVFGDLTEKPL